MRINTEEKQMDSGANKNVTNDKSIIRNYSPIQPIPIFGVDSRTAACHIIGKGITELNTVDGSNLDVTMYYSPHCAGTILSPNAIVRNSKHFTSWMQTSHLDTGQATILFYHRSDFTKNKSLPMTLSNDLWYIHQEYFPLVSKANRTHVCVIKDSGEDGYVTVHKMHKVTEYELWHQRLMHPGQVCMKYIDKCTKGVPSLVRNSFHQCKICDEMNIKKNSNKKSDESHSFRFGDKFQMDFGFMSAKTDNRIV